MLNKYVLNRWVLVALIMDSAAAWNSPGKNTRVGCHSLSKDLPIPETESKSRALQADSLPSEHEWMNEWMNENINDQMLLSKWKCITLEHIL